MNDLRHELTNWECVGEQDVSALWISHGREVQQRKPPLIVYVVLPSDEIHIEVVPRTGPGCAVSGNEANREDENSEDAANNRADYNRQTLLHVHTACHAHSAKPNGGL